MGSDGIVDSALNSGSKSVIQSLDWVTVLYSWARYSSMHWTVDQTV